MAAAGASFGGGVRAAGTERGKNPAFSPTVSRFTKDVSTRQQDRTDTHLRFRAKTVPLTKE